MQKKKKKRHGFTCLLNSVRLDNSVDVDAGAPNEAAIRPRACAVLERTTKLENVKHAPPLSTVQPTARVNDVPWV